RLVSRLNRAITKAERVVALLDRFVPLPCRFVASSERGVSRKNGRVARARRLAARGLERGGQLVALFEGAQRLRLGLRPRMRRRVPFAQRFVAPADRRLVRGPGVSAFGLERRGDRVALLRDGPGARVGSLASARDLVPRACEVVACGDRGVAIADQRVAPAHRLVAVADRVVALPGCLVALADCLFTTTDRLVALADGVFAMPDCLVALADRLLARLDRRVPRGQRLGACGLLHVRERVR